MEHIEVPLVEVDLTLSLTFVDVDLNSIYLPTKGLQLRQYELTILISVYSHLGSYFSQDAIRELAKTSDYFYENH